MDDKIAKVIEMSISTKTGDKGKTSFYCKGRMNKDSLRCEACGDLDELVSFLGLAKSVTKKRSLKLLIEKVQKALFKLGTEIVTKPMYVKYLKERITKDDIAFIEMKIKEFEKKIKMKGFVIPGVNLISSVLDIARAVARRLERRIVALRKKKMLKNEAIVPYLNRLSDLLYLCARLSEKNSRFNR